MRLSLKALFAFYGLCTAAAIGTPFAIRGLEYARRKAMPVNSEAPLEAAPGVVTVANSGNRAYALPACIGPHGTEYYGDRGMFYADGQTGNKRYFESDPWSSNFASCAVGDDDTVYVLALHDREGRLRAYSASGRLKWNVALPEVFSRVAISKSGGLYLLTRPWNGVTELKAYDSDGTERWKIQAGRTGGAQWNLVAPAIGRDGTIYLVSGDRDGPELMAAAPDGQKLWSTPLPGRATELILGTDGRIFIEVPAGNVIAFDLRGQRLWGFHSENSGIDGGIALGPDGTLYFASRFLHALNAEGKLKWTFKSEFTYTKNDYFDKQPVVAADGTIYAVSYNQQLYSVTAEGRKKWRRSGVPTDIQKCWDEIRLTPEGILIATAGRITVSSGLAGGAWPAQDHDNSNRRSLEVR